MTTYEVAQRALALAALLDSRLENVEEPAVIQAWASCFDGEDVFTEEALSAVRAHYKKPNPFPIKPGDILAHVKKLPYNSSPERVMAFLARWSQYPYSDAIFRLTGQQFKPTYPTPPGIHGDAAKEAEFHRAEHVAWIKANGHQLVAAAMSNPIPILALE